VIRIALLLLLFSSTLSCAEEPRWNEGIKPDGMHEFALWGLTARWIKEDDKVKKMCFFYMKRFVTCSNIPKTK